MYVYCYTRCSQPCSRPPVIHASARDSWTLPGKSGSVSCKISAPLSWVLVHTRFCLCHISQSCVSSSSSMVGLMATSSERAYAIPKSAAPRVPAPAAVYCWPIPPQETFRHSSISVSVRFLSPGVHNVFFKPPEPLSHHFIANRGEKWKQWQIFVSWAPKSLQAVTAAIKLKDICSLERVMAKLDSRNITLRTGLQGDQTSQS